jgi:secernin
MKIFPARASIEEQDGLIWFDPSLFQQFDLSCQYCSTFGTGKNSSGSAHHLSVFDHILIVNGNGCSTTFSEGLQNQKISVWTKVKDEDLATKRLLGMDFVRLGLERGSTAKEALEVITSLLDEYGQGGPCAENDDSFVYHNSFLIADPTEAWVLETAGRNWVAKRIVTGARNISNTLTIRTDYDLHSEGLEEYAIKHKLWNRHNTDGDTLDWTYCFGDGCDEECKSPLSRQSCGRKLLEKYSESKMLNETKMMEILRSHDGGICMHGGFETAASMVSVLRDDGDHKHWMLDQPHPCQHNYSLQSLTK